MTIKHWVLLGALLAGAFLRSAIDAVATPVPADPPPLIPAATPAPVAATPGSTAVKPSPKAAGKNTSSTATQPASRPEGASSGNLKPGAAVATEKNVNVRGQARINSEIVTHLKRGDVVTVLEQVTLQNPGNDEPGKWAKISLPAGSTVWVHSMFIEGGGQKVKPNRLNLRSGPGENYSILGRIDKGAVVKEIERKGSWIKIEAPTSAYAFAAAHLFSQEPALVTAALARTAPAPVAQTPVVSERPLEIVAIRSSPVVVVPPSPNLTPTPAPPTTPIATPTLPPQPPPTTVAVTPPPSWPEPPLSAPASAPAPIPAGELEPLVKRIVTREGFVRGSASIQAPTYFVLRALDNNKTINYLHSIDTNIVLRSFQYQRVIVVGEEILDERWPNTPVIDVESIEALP